jgi:hypothetical protein
MVLKFAVTRPHIVRQAAAYGGRIVRCEQNFYFANLLRKPISTPTPALNNAPLSTVGGGAIFNKLKIQKIKINMNPPINIDSKIACPIFELMWSLFSIFSINIVCPH